MNEKQIIHKKKSLIKSHKPLPSWMRSGHSFPPLRAGLIMYLYLNLTPVASGVDHVVQSDTIHGSGTVNKNKILNVDTTIFPSKLDKVKSIQIGLVTTGDVSWINE